MSNNYDLTPVMTRFLDVHMIGPLLDFVTNDVSLQRNILSLILTCYQSLKQFYEQSLKMLDAKLQFIDWLCSTSISMP